MFDALKRKYGTGRFFAEIAGEGRIRHYTTAGLRYRFGE